MTDQYIIGQIAGKLIVLSKLSISSMERKIIKEVINKELSTFDALDVMITFFMNKYRYAFPSLFLALNGFWTRFTFREWLEMIQYLDGNPEGLISWLSYTGKYMGIDGFNAALESDLISSEMKEELKNRVKKSPQPLNSHLEELLAWGLDFDCIHQKMVRSGGSPAKESHYGNSYFANTGE